MARTTLLIVILYAIVRNVCPSGEYMANVCKCTGDTNGGWDVTVSFILGEHTLRKWLVVITGPSGNVCES